MLGGAQRYQYVIPPYFFLGFEIVILRTSTLAYFRYPSPFLRIS
jgi:hypothetical protein